MIEIGELGGPIQAVFHSFPIVEQESFPHLSPRKTHNSIQETRCPLYLKCLPKNLVAKTFQ